MARWECGRPYRRAERKRPVDGEYGAGEEVRRCTRGVDVDIIEKAEAGVSYLCYGSMSGGRYGSDRRRSGAAIGGEATSVCDGARVKWASADCGRLGIYSRDGKLEQRVQCIDRRRSRERVGCLSEAEGQTGFDGDVDATGRGPSSVARLRILSVHVWIETSRRAQGGKRPLRVA